MVFEFEIDEQKHSLYFGMVATQIIAEKSINVATAKDNIKAFAYIVYGGLCNQADRKDKTRPEFEQAYDLTCEILEQSEDLQNAIYKAWESTKPAKAMLALLPKPPKEEGKKKSATKPAIGTK